MHVKAGPNNSCSFRADLRRAVPPHTEARSALSCRAAVPCHRPHPALRATRRAPHGRRAPRRAAPFAGGPAQGWRCWCWCRASQEAAGSGLPLPRTLNLQNCAAVLGSGVVLASGGYAIVLFSQSPINYAIVLLCYSWMMLLIYAIVLLCYFSVCWDRPLFVDFSLHIFLHNSIISALIA